MAVSVVLVLLVGDGQPSSCGALCLRTKRLRPFENRMTLNAIHFLVPGSRVEGVCEGLPGRKQ